jgi:hypothetical protein
MNTAMRPAATGRNAAIAHPCHNAWAQVPTLRNPNRILTAAHKALDRRFVRFIVRFAQFIAERWKGQSAIAKVLPSKAATARHSPKGVLK